MPLLGERAPDFELASTTGATVRLSETLDDGPTVVVVNRGLWCRYCAEQLATFDMYDYHLWRLLDTDVFPVLPDTTPELREKRDRWGLGLPLLADIRLDVVSSYTGIEDNDDRGRIPIPGTFIIDTEGVVRYEHVATRPDDRTYANHVRQVVEHDYDDPYPGEYPDPYTQ